MVLYGDLFVIYGDLMVIQWWFNGNFMVIPSENQFWWKIMGKTYVIDGTSPAKKKVWWPDAIQKNGDYDEM